MLFRSTLPQSSCCLDKTALYPGSARNCVSRTRACRYGGATPPFAIDGGGERSDRCLRCQGLQSCGPPSPHLDGVIKVQARGDGSPIHSQRFLFRKAFTAVSMGPMFGVDTTSALVKTISQFPQGLSNVQAGSTDLLFLPGAVPPENRARTLWAQSG